MSLPAPKNIFSCFNDKVVLVTGAGGSIGENVSAMFAAYGANLVLIDNHPGRLENITNRLQPDKVVSKLGDVTSMEDINKVVDSAISKFGKLDHVINIVGMKKLGGMEKETMESFDESLDDIRITFDVSKACLPHLLQSKGSIVNITSVASLRCYSKAVGYGTANAGLNQMSKIFAADLASKGIRVNTVSLTTVRSDYQLRAGILQTQEELEKYFIEAGSVMPLGRVALPEEVSHAILYLCSDAAAFITGVVLPIDGGYTLSDRRQL